MILCLQDKIFSSVRQKQTLFNLLKDVNNIIYSDICRIPLNEKQLS